METGAIFEEIKHTHELDREYWSTGKLIGVME
jgi:hypothetical protein